MHQRKGILIAALMVLIALVSVQQSSAAIYKYTDRDGMLNLADDLQSVPVEYRASAKIVSGERETKSETNVSANEPAQQPVENQLHGSASTPANSSASEQKVEAPAEQASFGGKLLPSILVVVSTAFIFVILGILDTDYKKTIAVVRIVVLWAMTLYLIYAHAGDVVRVFNKAGSEIDSAQQTSAEKGKKAAKAVKTLETLAEQAGQAAAADPRGADAGKKE